MSSITRLTDPKARVSLPKEFASTTVIIEQISDTELRIRKAQVVPEDEMRFLEESAAPLSDRERDAFLEMLDQPPPPTKALQKAASDYRKRRARKRDG
ncbi:MAG: DUF1778 domain-containing protein [Gemmataceae bacterium]